MTTTLFIATSLDGYIAGPDDDLSWLFTDADYGFANFVETVDTLVMGRGTYEVVNRLGKWPYNGKTTFVVSRTPDLKITTEDTSVHSGSLPELQGIIEESGADVVWLVGGGELVTSYLKEKLIDRLVVSLHPVMLGKGVPLFPGGFPKTVLDLEEAESFDSGLVQLSYRIRH